MDQIILTMFETNIEILTQGHGITKRFQSTFFTFLQRLENVQNVAIHFLLNVFFVSWGCLILLFMVKNVPLNLNQGIHSDFVY